MVIALFIVTLPLTVLAKPDGSESIGPSAFISITVNEVRGGVDRTWLPNGITSPSLTSTSQTPSRHAWRFVSSATVGGTWSLVVVVGAGSDVVVGRAEVDVVVDAGEAAPDEADPHPASVRAAAENSTTSFGIMASLSG